MSSFTHWQTVEDQYKLRERNHANTVIGMHNATSKDTKDNYRDI
jgi:hypothetical protein